MQYLFEVNAKLLLVVMTCTNVFIVMNYFFLFVVMNSFLVRS